MLNRQLWSKKSDFQSYCTLCFLLQFTFTGDAVNVAELVATAAVALVGAVHIGTLLTARSAFTLIHICTWQKKKKKM